MTHKQIFDLIQKWMPLVKLDDATNQLACAQAAYGRFTRMTPGREDLFDSSYSELCGVMTSIVDAWIRHSLSPYFMPGHAGYEPAVCTVTNSFWAEEKHIFIQPCDSQLPCAVALSFPPDFVLFSKGVK